MQTNLPVAERPTQAVAPGRPQSLLSSGGTLAIIVVAVCFLPYLARPFAVLADTGYQALSAHQYAVHFTPNFYSIRTVNPRDLAKDSISQIDAWAPSWVAFFQIAFKLGLAPGTTGRLLAFVLSLIGALGWVRVASIVGLRGWWRSAAIVFAALYCLRAGSVTSLGQNDLLVYAVAPWLLAAGNALSVSLSATLRNRIVAKSALFCLGLGAVYWLKYNAIFLSGAILLALLIEQFRTVIRKRLLWSLAVLTLYGAAFVTPAIVLKIYNYARSGTDFIEASASHSPARTPARMTGLVEETAFYASTVLFSAGPGANRVAGNWLFSAPAWFVRLPGLVLLFLIIYLMWKRSSSWLRNMAILCLGVPLLAFPLLSFAGGARFTFALTRSCEAYWIFAELVVIRLLSEGPGTHRAAWRTFFVLTAFQLMLFLWIPRLAINDIHSIIKTKKWNYQTTATRLYQPDLSTWGARDAVENIKSLVHSPKDVIVLAVYSEHGYASDIMQEFDNRLLPVTGYARFGIHSVPASDYEASAPFRSSEPLRIILVTTHPDTRADFEASTERIMRRFPQVREWKPGPADPHQTYWMWTGEIE